MLEEELELASDVPFELGQADQPLSLALSEKEEDEFINYEDPYIQALLKLNWDD